MLFLKVLTQTLRNVWKEKPFKFLYPITARMSPRLAGVPAAAPNALTVPSQGAGRAFPSSSLRG
jgi:hypothetical protein